VAFADADLITVSSLVRRAVMLCDGLQGEICQLADDIKDNLRPAAKKELDIEDEEYDRLFDLAKTAGNDSPRSNQKVIDKKVKIGNSISAFNVGVTALG
jgi:hypothetical protein